MESERDYFQRVAERLESLLRPGEIYTAWLEGEDSDFVRFNHNRVRQAGHVTQRTLTLRLIEGRRHAAASLELSGRMEADEPLLRERVAGLRARRGALPEDPLLLYAETVRNSEDSRTGTLPEPDTLIATVTDLAAGLDLVGAWAGGRLFAGFANSLGQRNWHTRSSFSFDWSLYLSGDRAVKARYAGAVFDAAVLARKLDRARADLARLAQPPRPLPRGRYRAYLAPAALRELLALVAGSGFSLNEQRTCMSPLLRLVAGEATLHPAVRLVEDTAAGFAPRFTPEGFLRPDRVVLVEGGRYREALVGPRSSRDYGLPVNAGSETPRALRMAPGTLPAEAAAGLLDTGLYLNNLWYCNYSDRNDCRITGLTRFACFRVENGEIREPLPVMRFDDSLLRLLGDGLLALTRETEWLADTDTYEGRSLAGMDLPGILVEDFHLSA